MRSLPSLAVDAVVVFDAIAAAKHQPRRGRLRAARTGVLGSYLVYELAAPEVGQLPEVHLAERQKEALRHAFDVETEPMTALRGDLLKRIVVARCPLCGISESSTLDHYLPKERYPEFSVYPNNLVPCCALCNTRKRDRILLENTDIRAFLHPCYDAIPDTEFLIVQVRMEESALILAYRLIRPGGMGLRTFRHLRSHFTALDLADRYRRMALEHLGGQYPALRRAYGAGENSARVTEELIEGAEDYEDVYGKNFWLAKLYRALAASQEFCDGGFEAIRVSPHLQ